MCLTLPDVLVTVMGIEKVLPSFGDLGTFLRLLPRSSTGERMNPYTSLWTGVTPGDGPAEFHLVLLDNGRSNVLAQPDLRQTLRCIRCSACLNVCPVYERVGGHAYGSTYPGPIGAVLTPQLVGVDRAGSLAYASTLCGACYDVCPVLIDIPDLLIRLRAAAVEASPHPTQDATFRGLGLVFRRPGLYRAAQRLAGLMPSPRRLAPPPLSRWTISRDLPRIPRQSFRRWWAQRGGNG
jgi:L-lactate dehydrogenase complex protein LldF